MNRELRTAGAARDGARAPSHIGANAALLLMVAIWAVNFSVIKVGLDAIPPLGFNALRFPLASLAVWIVLRRRGPIPLPAREDVGRIVALGLLGNIAYQLLFILGLDRTGAGNAALLLAGSPLIVALLSAASGHERVEPRVWTGVVATCVGLALVVLGGPEALTFGLETIAGDLILLGASVAWSVYTVGAQRPIARYGSVAVTAWTLWIATPGVVMLGAADLAALDVPAVPAAAWGAVAFAGVMGIGIAYLIWYHGVQVIGNTRTATYSNLTPVLALLVAWLWLGEVPGVWQMLGAAVIIGGVTAAQR